MVGTETNQNAEYDAKLKDLRTQYSEIESQIMELLLSDKAKVGNPGNEEFIKESNELAQKRTDILNQIQALEAQLGQ